MFRPVITAVVTNTPQHLEYFIDIYFIIQLFGIINKKYEHVFCVILGFRHEVDENCALLRHYAASSGNYVFIYIYIYIYIYPTRCNVTQFILSGKCSTCFGSYLHPSSGAQTVSTASGICPSVTAICRCRGRVGTGLSVPIAVTL